MPPVPVPGSKLGMSIVAMTSSYPASHLFFFFQSRCNVHTYIHTHTYICIRILEIYALTSLRPRIPNHNELGSLDLG
jgi:hypothetical protein